MHNLQSFSERGIEFSAPLGEGSSTTSKRPHSDNLENPGPTKRARNAPIGPRIMPPLPPISEPDDDVQLQCAYYAIELLRVSWKASHASGILLRGKFKPHSQIRRFISLLVDEFLEILWYDPQGCIRTTPIDIVKELPLLVVLVRAQRRSKYLSGLRNTPIPGSFDPIEKTTPRFQLVGRMSSWGKVNGSTDEAEATHFFKSS